MNPLLIMGVLCGVLTIGVGIQTKRVESCKAEYASFVANVKTAGEAAEARTKAEIARQAKLLKETEATSAKAKSDLSIANQRLRDERARSGSVPPAPAGSKRPDLACFDRTLLVEATGRLDAGLSALADRGDQNTLRLKLSRDWANSIALPPHQ